MVTYRETAMRHGDRWLVRKRKGMEQELRKGKGAPSELQAKLAILQEVSGQRAALMEEARETIRKLEMEQKRLDGMKKAAEKEIAESEPARRKKGIEKQMEECRQGIEGLAGKMKVLEGIGKNGLAATSMKFWEKQLA
jgi:chromosome segregation ATPase